MKANVDIRTGEVLAGRIPPKDLRAVRTWIEPRRDALEDAFFAALRHEPADTIIRSYREATDDL